MKIYCISWKDERWSADKKSLQAINELISKEKPARNGWEETVWTFKRKRIE